MKSLFRSLLVWLLLLALPYQGLASAAMLPSARALLPAPASAHAHEEPAASAHMPPCHEQAFAHAAIKAGKGGHAAHGAAAKCGCCNACCAVAGLPPFHAGAPALAPPQYGPIPFHAAHLPSVDPVLPERPPRTILA